jgi:NAD-dependent SIR2 family protein deacetylase
MQKGHLLQFSCQSCQQAVCFSVFELEKNQGCVTCANCQLAYDFSDEVLMRQLIKFNDLCRQIQISEEILSNTSVGIYVGDREVKIPFKILLSRLNSTLNLMMGDHPLTITFRIEPCKDLAAEKLTLTSSC